MNIALWYWQKMKHGFRLGYKCGENAAVWLKSINFPAYLNFSFDALSLCIMGSLFYFTWKLGDMYLFGKILILLALFHISMILLSHGL
jgi:hypothetical protein